MSEIRNKQFIESLVKSESGPSIPAQASVARSFRFNKVLCNNLNSSDFVSLWRQGFVWTLLCAVCLILSLAVFGANIASAESTYPDLRDAHDPELQKALDKALDHPLFWDGVQKKELSVVVDERYGKLYDPAYGGGLWVGKEYGKAPAWRGDPLNGISLSSTALCARLFALYPILLQPRRLKAVEHPF